MEDVLFARAKSSRLPTGYAPIKRINLEDRSQRLLEKRFDQEFELAIQSKKWDPRSVLVEMGFIQMESSTTDVQLAQRLVDAVEKLQANNEIE